MVGQYNLDFEDWSAAIITPFVIMYICILIVESLFHARYTGKPAP